MHLILWQFVTLEFPVFSVVFHTFRDDRAGSLQKAGWVCSCTQCTDNKPGGLGTLQTNMSLTLFSAFKSYFKSDGVQIDNGVFRLHYRYTVCLLLIASASQAARQFVGDPIFCHIRGEGGLTSLVTNFCWIHGTYTLRLVSLWLDMYIITLSGTKPHIPLWKCSPRGSTTVLRNCSWAALGTPSKQQDKHTQVWEPTW